MVCKICGNDQGNQTHRAREMMFGFRDEFTYLECAKCGCLQLMDPPNDLSKYYPPTYYSFSVTPLAIFNHPVKNLAKRFRHTYAVTNQGALGKVLYERSPDPVVRTLLGTGITKRSRIVDVGCGSGLLLYILKNAGFRNVLGIDPFIESTITYKNGLVIRKESLHDLQGEWDLVMLHHAFEHVPDPVETLASAHRVLSDGGMCLIRIPIASSYAWQNYGKNWVQLDAPRHFFLHTVESMRVAAAQASLNLERVAYDSTELQFWGSEQYVLDIPLESERSYSKNPAQSPFSPAQIDAFRARAQQLNEQQLGDQAVFYLRKGQARRA